MILWTTHPLESRGEPVEQALRDEPVSPVGRPWPLWQALRDALFR